MIGLRTRPPVNDSIDRILRVPRCLLYFFRSRESWLRVTSKEATLDRTVADLNIAHFKKLLSAETDPAKRRTIERLLAEEEAKLAQAQRSKKDSPDRT